MVCVPLLLALLVVCALIGIFVGIFFSTVVFQRILQKHIHLLHMRTETQRVIVVDLAESVDIEAGLRLGRGATTWAGTSAPSNHQPIRGRTHAV